VSPTTSQKESFRKFARYQRQGKLIKSHENSKENIYSARREDTRFMWLEEEGKHGSASSDDAKMGGGKDNRAPQLYSGVAVCRSEGRKHGRLDGGDRKPGKNQHVRD